VAKRPRTESIGYRRLNEGSQEAGRKAITAALSSEVPHVIGKLRPKSLLTGAATGRRPVRRRPATLPYADQTHDHIEIACVISGRCLVQVNDRHYEVREEDVCLFTPCLMHSDTFVDRNSPYSLLWFTLGNKQVGAHLTRYSRRTGFNIVFGVSSDMALSAVRLTKDILRAFSGEGMSVDSLARFKACLLELASIVLNRLLQGETAPRRDWRGKVIDDVVRFLQARYLENPSLADVSNRVRLSPNYLCSLFHKYTGQTIVGCMNSLRMKRAEELLLNSNLSMKEIAREAGFRSAHYFSRTFHRMHGVSPTSFRSTHT